MACTGDMALTDARLLSLGTGAAPGALSASLLHLLPGAATADGSSADSSIEGAWAGAAGELAVRWAVALSAASSHPVSRALAGAAAGREWARGVSVSGFEQVRAGLGRAACVRAGRAHTRRMAGLGRCCPQRCAARTAGDSCATAACSPHRQVPGSGVRGQCRLDAAAVSAGSGSSTSSSTEGGASYAVTFGSVDFAAEALAETGALAEANALRRHLAAAEPGAAQGLAGKRLRRGVCLRGGKEDKRVGAHAGCLIAEPDG
jgi:hypothetical protein